MRKTLPFLCLLAATLGACKSSKEEFRPETPDQYVQLAAGKYIIYKLDSTVFVNSGRTEEHHFYQERHLVDAPVTDALGRPSWRIFRALRDSAGTGGWRQSGSYLATVTNGSLELIEDNLRTVRLATPTTSGATWKGNRFLPAEPYANLFNFSNDDAPGFGDWNYNVTASGETVSLNGHSYSDVITVDAIDESLNYPITIPSSYAYRSYFQEQWAKGVGLIHQNYVLWEYQPNPNGTPYRIGFGIDRSILDHN